MKRPGPETWLAGIALLLPLVFAPFLHEHFILPRVFVFALLALPLFYFSLRTHPDTPMGSVGLGLLLCLLATGLSLLLSPSPRLMIPGTALLVAGLGVAMGWQPARDRDRVERMLVLALGIVVGYGFLQLAGMDPFDWRARDVAGRAAVFSTLGNVNWLAAWLAVALHLLAGPDLFTRKGGHWRKLVLASGLLLLILLRSRGALLGFLGGVVVRGWYSMRNRSAATSGGGRKRWEILLVFLLLLGLAETGLHWTGNETLSRRLISLQGVSDRLFIASTALGMLGDCLPFGCGPGNFAYLYPDALAPRLDPARPEMVRLSAHARHAHCDPLEVLLELGPLGLAGFLLIFAVPLGRGLRSADGSVVPGTAALTAFLLCGLLDSPFSHPATFFLALLAALQIRDGRPLSRQRRWPELPSWLNWLILAGVAVLVFRGVGGQVISSAYLAQARHQLAGATGSTGILLPAALQNDSARRALQSAWSWSRAHGEVAQQLGALELLAGNPREALRLLLLAAETMVEPAVEYNLALCCRQLGELRTALHHFRRAASLSPWSAVHARALEGEGQTLIALGAEGAGFDALFTAMLRDREMVTQAPAVVKDLGQRGRPALAAALAARVLQAADPVVASMRADLLALRSKLFLALEGLPLAVHEWQEMEEENLRQDRINLAVSPLLDDLLRQSLREAEGVHCWTLLLDRLRYHYVRMVLLP